MTAVKICGVTRAEDAAHAAAAGAAYVGINFWPKSKRYVERARAPALVAAARVGGAKVVGIVVDMPEDAVIALAGDLALDVVQLHGDESRDAAAAIAGRAPCAVWKAIAVGSPHDVDHLETWPVAALVLDAPTPGRGGAGARFDWAIAAAARARYRAQRFVLAGGLTPGNVAAAIAAVDPWLVDVASGVESGPGLKDAALVAAFIAAARG